MRIAGVHAKPYDLAGGIDAIGLARVATAQRTEVADIVLRRDGPNAAEHQRQNAKRQ